MDFLKKNWLLTSWLIMIILLPLTYFCVEFSWRFHLFVAETFIILTLSLFTIFRFKSTFLATSTEAPIDKISDFFSSSNELLSFLQTVLVFSLGIVLYANGVFSSFFEDNGSHPIIVEGNINEEISGFPPIDSTKIILKAMGEKLDSTYSDENGYFKLETIIQNKASTVIVLYYKDGYSPTFKEDGAGNHINGNMTLIKN